jgi:hypothetical protein
MALRTRQTVATGAPDGQSCWVDSGGRIPLGATTAGTSATAFMGHAVQGVAKTASGSVNVADFVPPGVSIRQLNGALLALSALLAAQTTLDVTLSVYRTVGTLGATGGASTTSVPLTVPLQTAMPSGSTATITELSGGASTTLTLTAAAPVGATSLAVSSVNLTGYASGSPIVWQVGNGPVLGWLTSGVGTPAFAAYSPVLMPWITANTSVQGGSAGPNYLPLQVGDLFVASEQTSTSTVAVPSATITTLEN